MDSAKNFIEWGVKTRGEDPKFLAERFERFRGLVGNHDITDLKDKRAFLMTPREKFVLKQNLGRAYEHAFLDIGFGVTISGPYIVGRMTQVIDVKPGDKVLEIGTGSGYQSAYLANLTDKVWTIEIIKPLEERTTGIRSDLIKAGYSEYKAIQAKNADGYYGWEDAGPFDKIIVTCGIDHVPPPLLQQLKVGGIMVIPVGPARRAARAEDRQVAGQGRPDLGRPLRHLQRPHRALRALHQARQRRQDRRHPQQVTHRRAFPSPARGRRWADNVGSDEGTFRLGQRSV